jgi:hypothetical protein
MATVPGADELDLGIFYSIKGAGKGRITVERGTSSSIDVKIMDGGLSF